LIIYDIFIVLMLHGYGYGTWHCTTGTGLKYVYGVRQFF